MTDLSTVFTQSEFGELVGISQRAVSELMAREVIAEGEPAAAWLLCYCDHLRNVAAGRAAAGDLDLAQERALLARAQRIRIETRNAVDAKTLAPAYLIEEILTRAAAKIAAVFDGIPGKVKRRLPHLPAAGLDIIRAEVAAARNIVAGMSLDDVVDDLSEREADAQSETDDEAEVDTALVDPADSNLAAE